MIDIGQLRGVLAPFKKMREKEFSWRKDTYYYSIDESSLEQILYEINDFIVTDRAKMAQLEAKIYAYEAILSNSNFKMAVVRSKKREDEE